MAHVAHVQVQAEWCGPRRGGVAERGTLWWIVRAGVLLEPGPDARERQQISQVERVEEGLPDVLVAVAGKSAKVGLEGIHLLQPRAEAVMLELLDHLARRGVQPLAVGIEQQHIAGEVAEADDVGAGLTHGVVRVLGHGHRVLVRERDRPKVERFLEKPQQPVSLLEPVPPVDA